MECIHIQPHISEPELEDKSQKKNQELVQSHFIYSPLLFVCYSQEKGHMFCVTLIFYIFTSISIHKMCERTLWCFWTCRTSFPSILIWNKFQLLHCHVYLTDIFVSVRFLSLHTNLSYHVFPLVYHLSSLTPRKGTQRETHLLLLYPPAAASVIFPSVGEACEAPRLVSSLINFQVNTYPRRGMLISSVPGPEDVRQKVVPFPDVSGWRRKMTDENSKCQSIHLTGLLRWQLVNLTHCWKINREPKNC